MLRQKAKLKVGSTPYLSERLLFSFRCGCQDVKWAKGGIEKAGGRIIFCRVRRGFVAEEGGGEA